MPRRLVMASSKLPASMATLALSNMPLSSACFLLRRSTSSELMPAAGFAAPAAPGARRVISGVRVISPNTTFWPVSVPTRLPFLAVIVQVPPTPAGIPARIHSPFLSVTVLSWRLKSPTKSRMISTSGTGFPLSSRTLPRIPPCWAEAGADSPVSSMATAPTWSARSNGRVMAFLLDPALTLTWRRFWAPHERQRGEWYSGQLK